MLFLKTHEHCLENLTDATGRHQLPGIQHNPCPVTAKRDSVTAQVPVRAAGAVRASLGSLEDKGEAGVLAATIGKYLLPRVTEEGRRKSKRGCRELIRGVQARTFDTSRTEKMEPQYLPPRLEHMQIELESWNLTVAW